MKASALGIYAVLSTVARYISSTPLGYVNGFDKQYSAKYYTPGYKLVNPWLRGIPSAVIRTALGLRPRAVLYSHLGYIPRNHGLPIRNVALAMVILDYVCVRSFMITQSTNNNL